MFLSGILIVASCILEGVDSLEDVGRGKDEGDLDSEKRTRAKRGVLSMDALLVKILDSVVTPLENFLQKCSMGYNLYPWISLLEFTLETSYKPQT